MQQQRNLTTMSQMMAQILDLQNKVNSLSDARIFHDPESDPRSWSIFYDSEFQDFATLRLWIAAKYTELYGYYGKRFLNDHLLKKDYALQSSTIQRFWLLPLRVWDLIFQSRSGILNHTGGTYSLSGMMDYPRVLVTEWNLGQFPDSVEFQSWTLNFRTEVFMRTADPQVTMLWIKEVEVSKSIDELVTSRSITGQHDFPDFEMLDAMIASALKQLINTQSTFRRESKCRRATSPKPILTRKTDCVHDLRGFPCNRAEWRCPRFRCEMGSCPIICEWNAFRPDPGRIVEFRSSSDFDGIVWSRSCSKQWDTKLSTTAKCSETSYWSNDEKSEFQSPERCCGTGISYQESQGKTRPALRRRWESVFSGKHMDNVPKDTDVVSVMTL